MRRQKNSLPNHQVKITDDNSYSNRDWARILIHFSRKTQLSPYLLEGIYSTFYIHFKHRAIAEEAFEHCIHLSIETQTHLGNIAGTVIADIAHFKKTWGFQ